MLLKFNVTYYKIFGKKQIMFVIPKTKQNVLNFRANTYHDNVTAIQLTRKVQIMNN
jgi:hypothetical protein